MFVGLGLSGVVPILHGLSMYGFHALNERMGLVWVMLEGAMYIFGAFLYAVSHGTLPLSQRSPWLTSVQARFPERVSPGTFDIWGSSHQIFHVFVVLAAVSHLYGMAIAFDFHHSVLGAKC
jgi:adiponectin receptor